MPNGNTNSNIKPIEEELSNKKQKNHKKNTKNVKKLIDYRWIFQVFVISFTLGAIFSVLSELILRNSGLVLVIIVITVLLFINILFDVIGMAFASASPEPFVAMASKKIRGAKRALKLLKSANKVSSFCQDIMGDICGIISGTAGATAVLVIAGAGDSTNTLLVSVLVSGVIASLTIAGKATTKSVAMTYSTDIVFFVGRFLTFFKKEK